MIDRGEWLEARRKGIGGSDAAAILGLSRYRSAIDVWEDKLGLAPERPQTPAMAWGLRLEDAIATAYTEATGRRVRKAGGIRRAHHVTDYPMIASIDRLSADGERVVELKKKRTADDLDDNASPEKRVPADWYVQTQHYLEVVDREVADVAILVGGTEFRIIEIPRDRDFGADLRVEEGTFWREYVEKEVQPPVTADDLDFLSRKYPRSVDEEKVATPELAALVDEILAIDVTADGLEREKKDLRAKIEEYLGDAAKLLTPRATVSWKTQERTTVGWKELAGSLERMVRELASHLEVDDMTGIVVGLVAREVPLSREVVPYLPEISPAYGPGLDGLRSLYSASSTVRPFRIDRKKEGSK